MGRGTGRACDDLAVWYPAQRASPLVNGPPVS